MLTLPDVTYSTINKEKEPFSLLIYGDSNTGKTTLAGSVIGNELFEPVLVADIDKNLSVLAGKDVMRAEINTPYDMMRLRDDLLLPDEKRPEAIRGTKTLIIDSVSAFRDITMVDSARVSIQAGKNSDKKNPRSDPYVTELRDYSRALNLVTDIIREVRQTKMHVIVIAGLIEEYDEYGILRQTYPDLNPKMRNALKYMFSNVWYTHTNSDEQRAVKVLLGDNKKVYVKTKGEDFIARLKGVTKGNTGFFVIPNSAYPTLSVLYELYLKG